MQSIGSDSPFQDAVNYFNNLSNLNNGGKLVYNHAGAEYTELFTRRSDSTAHGTILKWGYADKYIRIIRIISGESQSTDWEKISAGYSDSAGNADTVDNQHFSYSNDSNSPTYLWATNSNGSSFLAARGSISVNYANSAGTSGSADNATNATNASNLKHNSSGALSSISFYVASGVSETLAPAPSYCKPAGVDSDGNTMILRMRWSSGAYGHDIYAGPNAPELWHRNTKNNTEECKWRKIIDSGNIGSQSVSYATSAGSAASATTASSVTVNSSDSNSTYRMVWHSGNTLYGTDGIYCNPSTDSLYASAFYETSDERLKDFENNVNVDLNLIRSIPKMYFRWKKNSNKLQIGTSAQAVKQLYPELVTSSEDGMLSVDYSKLSIVALSAIDKLHLENQDLKREINILKQEIEKLKGQI